MLDLRLISADVLKLRRRRGMLAIALLLTLGVDRRGVRRHGHPARRQPRQVRPGRRRRELQGRHRASWCCWPRRRRHHRRDGRHPGHRVRRLPRPRRHRPLAHGAVRRRASPGAWAVVLPILAVSAAAHGRAPHRAGRLAGRPGRRRDRWPARPAVLAAGALSSAVAVGVSALVGSRGPVIGDRARVLPGHRADAGRDLVPGRRAPGDPRRRAGAGSATRATPMCTSRSASPSRSSPRGSSPPRGSAHGAPSTREI